MTSERIDALSDEEEARVLLFSEDVRAACLAIQEEWTPRDRRDRAGLSCKVAEWSAPQFLVHHEEAGRWAGGRCRSVRIWRCVDGR